MEPDNLKARLFNLQNRLIEKAGILSWLFIFLLMFGLSLAMVHRQVPLRNAFAFVCDKVSRTIYLPENTIQPWLKQCLQEAEKTEVGETNVQVKIRINAILAQLHVSHLSIYSPEQVQKIWKSEYKTTGITANYIDGEVVVTDVLPSSPAQQVGILRGDLLKKINGQLAMAEDALATNGDYEIQRHGQNFTLHVETAELQINDEIQISKLNSKQSRLLIPSFRSEFFNREDWFEKIKQLKDSTQIIIDLRKNAGGNFAAGLRFLSTFICEPTTVGSLRKPKFLNQRPHQLPDAIDDATQMNILDQSSEVILKTFPDYPCIDAQLLVLVSPQTSSTAEIVAQALSDELKTPVWGATTSGQCLVGIWYPLPVMGPGFEISIPEANYQTRSGYNIESSGVKVSKTLYERLEDFQNGKDSALVQAQNYFSK